MSLGKVQTEKKAIVYAGIIVNKQEEDILSLPPDHAIYPKVDIEEFDTDMEKCIIKCQWEVNKEERVAEQKRVDKEVSEDVEKVDNIERTDDAGIKSMDFRNMRATKLKNNKVQT